MADELEGAFVKSKVSHWAPNCSTFSRARERPIPGVKFPPKPLRSDSCPRGIPEEISKLPSPKRRKVEDDTKMAESAANHCIQAHREGKFFSLEHPKNSIARKLPSWEELESMEGVMCTEYHTCMFYPSERKKSQCLIHNIPALAAPLGKLCQGPVCQRTGKKHKDWRPRVEKGRVQSFATGEEREYPSEFCTTYANALEEMRNDEDFVFLEVFSGPNAPLSHAVAKAVGETLGEPRSSISDPMATTTERSRGGPCTREDGKPREIGSHSSESHPGGIVPAAHPCIPEESHRKYRQDAVASGKQPSYGKRVQLIPDGLNCPGQHFRLAQKLQHPFSSLEPLKADHERVVECLKREGKEILKNRLKSLHALETLVKDLRQEQEVANRSAAWTTKKLGAKIQTVLMTKLQGLLNLEDTKVPDACLYGLGIVREASESAFFTPYRVPPSISWGKYLATCQSRSQEMISRVKFMGQKGGSNSPKPFMRRP